MSREQARHGRSRPPIAFVVLAAIAVVFFLLPLIGLLARTPWSDLISLLASEVVADALVLSALVLSSFCAPSFFFSTLILYPECEHIVNVRKLFFQFVHF